VDEIQPDTAETRDLLEEAGAGDRQAFERLFARHRGPLRAFVERRLDPRVRARVDPSDVVQETQLEVYRRLDDFLRRRPMPFHLWLRKTAYERLLKVRRRHVSAAQRSVRRETAWPDPSSVLLAQRLLRDRPSPSQPAIQEETVRRVRQALDRLGEVDREIILLRLVEELPYQEAACLLGVEPAAARQRYGRALLRLRKTLIADGLLEGEP
jgi:RNA polymerase sigma-70 factor, ECF subfamily